MAPPAIKLEAFNIYPSGESDYRFLVDDTHTKYVTVEAGALQSYRPSSNLISFPCQPRVLGAALPSFPPGDWNVSHITTCPLTKAPVFGSTSLQSFPSVSSLWHDTTIGHDELTWAGGAGGRFRQNVGLVTCPQFRGRVVYKFAAFPWMIREIERETTAYQLISQHRTEGGSARGKRFWAPRFLGHVKEKSGRVVGFLMEYTPGRRPHKDNTLDARLCERALGKLHNVGLMHGKIGYGDFLIQTGKKSDEAVLIDFANAVTAKRRVELLEEMADLHAILEGQERNSSSEDDMWDHAMSPRDYGV